MPLGLAGDGQVDGGIEFVVAGAGAQQRAEIEGVVLAQAHIECAGAGEPHAIAAFAEIMGHRRDEADPLAGFGHGVIPRRAAGAIAGILGG